ncbi:MAG: winged helix-turn-helix transcriptional regulator [Clostridia bacterium]|nr:winged helix-turn-helix transcriptional regulator [Clostridia bacterium]
MQENTCSACQSIAQQIKSNLPGEADVTALTDFFNVLGSPTRLKILLALDAHELCAGHLAEAVSMAPSAVSNQLKALKAARLVTVRREGKMLYYSLADCHPREIIHLAMSHVKEDGE